MVNSLQSWPSHGGPASRAEELVEATGGQQERGVVGALQRRVINRLVLVQLQGAA